MAKLIEMRGWIFGNWRVPRDAVPTSKRTDWGTIVYWPCLCTCGSGVERSVRGASLRLGLSKGCGDGKTGCHHCTLRPYESSYNKFLAAAKSRGYPPSVSYDDFLAYTQISQCHYCLSSIKWEKYSGHGTIPYNLDRKDNNATYTKDNIVVCCTRCNYGKGNRFTYEEWWEMTTCFRNRQMATTTA